MLKKSIKYTDFNGKERTEDFYFNLTRAELATMELSTKGGMKEKIEQIVESNNGEEIITFFLDIIRRAYGERSEDGRVFNKSNELSNLFVNSAAYDVLFMELVTDPRAAADFINAVLPQTN